jgi:hypothetical protein
LKLCTRLRHRHTRPVTPCTARGGGCTWAFNVSTFQPQPVAVILPDMPGCLSTTFCLPVVGRFGRCASRHKSQSSISPFSSPTPGLIELTSNRLHSPIYILNDDTLLHIFHLFQLHIQEEYPDADGARTLDWVRQRWWYKLVHVSRQWRYLILGSRTLLDLHLVCTYGVPVADMLAHSPPLPLTIVYYGNPKMTAEDE